MVALQEAKNNEELCLDVAFLDTWAAWWGQEVSGAPELRGRVTSHWLTLSSIQKVLVTSHLCLHAMTYNSGEAGSPMAVGHGQPIAWPPWAPCPGWQPTGWAFRPQGGGRAVECCQEMGLGLFPSWSLQVLKVCCWLPAIVDSHQPLQTIPLWKQRN